MRTIYILVILVLLMLVVPAAPAHAGGVVTVCDEVHLRTALAGGGTVTFTCSGTITLTAWIGIAADTAIDGSGQAVTISGNHVVQVFFVGSGATLNLNGLTITNGSTGTGGGIYNHGGTLMVSNSIFSGNSADRGGGIVNDGVMTVSNSTFSGNSASNVGGGIYNAGGGTGTVSNSTFSGNSAIGEDWCAGGGIFNGGESARLTVSNSTFSGNSSADYGGGISNAGRGTLTVSNSTFTGNAAVHGGGLSIDYGTGNVSSSTFSGDSARYGGGIFIVSSTVEVSNSTFYDNSADYGGGIFIDSGTVRLSNSTFSGDSARYGGGIFNADSAMTLKNTIVTDSPTGNNCFGTITDGGGNLSYPDTTCPGINATPMLGPLQNNGGPTETMAPGPGSAAIDAGIDAICAADPVNNLDQRGVTRPMGTHCDIGAVEQEPYPSLPFRMWLPSIRAR